MNRDEFWEVIESARAKNSAEPEEGLREELSSLSADQLASFQQHFDDLVDAAYRWDLWGAAYLIGGGCSDDGFIDFRYGLISLGRATYEAALASPDSLVTVEDEISNESFGYVASELYEEMSGGDLERKSSGHSHPIGDEWDFDDDKENRRRLPKLHAKFGGAA
jgi:hypothetical protein